MPEHQSCELSLGPVLFLWQGPEWRDFYFRIADEAPVDTVTIGEVVCSKRQHFISPHLREVAERLVRAGKKVRLASLALVTLPREQKAVRGLTKGGDLEIEVNDLSVLASLDGRPHAIGPLVSVYSAATARFFASRGAVSICLPPELPLASLTAISSAVPEVAIEAFAFGRMPLAMSARCAHARVKGQTKDTCGFVCGDDPDGLVVETLDEQKFLTLNGIQTMSYTCHAALREIDALVGAGVRSLRLSPQSCDMVAVAQTYRDVLDGRKAGDEAMAALGGIYPDVPLSNGFLHGRPGADLVSG
jgi:O2-independent ubiquinone biosynthesis protein UbiV